MNLVTFGLKDLAYLRFGMKNLGFTIQVTLGGLLISGDVECLV